MIKVSERITLPADLGRVRALLADIQLVIPCIPGAWLGERLGEDRYAGGIAVTYADIGLRFHGELTTAFAEDGVVRVAATGDAGAQLKAKAEIGLRAIATRDDATELEITAAVDLSGPLAGLASSVSRFMMPTLMRAFGKCLATKI